MKVATIILIILLLIGILAILYFNFYNKLSYLFSKTKYAEDLIDKDLDKKYKLLVKINNLMKKTLHAKKDYLVAINDFSSEELFSSEKDVKLKEYTTTVNNLISDYTKLANHKEIKKQVNNLHEIDEKLDASKTYFNKYMVELSKLSTKLPTSLIAKVNKIKVKQLYETNETIKKISEDL